MRSPIGLFLTEFRPAGAIPLLPAPMQHDVIALSAELTPLGLDLAEPMPMLPAFDADPEPMPFGLDATDHASPHEPDNGMAEALAALQADHAAALADARARWAAQEGAALAAGFAQALADFETRIGETLAPLLEPFLVKAAQIKVIDALRGHLATLLGSGEPGTITVKGPADLLAGIAAAHPGTPALVYAEAETPDVTIRAGDTTVRSQLQVWATSLEQSLGDQA